MTLNEMGAESEGPFPPNLTTASSATVAALALQRRAVDRPDELHDQAVCLLGIGFLGLCAWAGMALVSPVEKEETELPTHRVTHDSMCATTTYDGELIRWYVMMDPDYQIQYLVNDRGGCCVRLDSDGNVMGVSDEENEEADPYEWE